MICKRKSKKLIIMGLIIIIYISFSMLPISVPADTSTDGIQNRIDSLRQLFPTDSYFSKDGGACIHTQDRDCDNCQLSVIINNRFPEYKNAGLNESSTCSAFARFAYYYIFGLNTFNYQGSTEVSLSNAKVGDFVNVNNKGHWGIFLYASNGQYYLYESNYEIPNKVAYAKTGYPASAITAVWRANNYDAKNAEYLNNSDTEPNDENTYVDIPDETFKEFLNKKLFQESGSDITKEQLLTIKSLYLMNSLTMGNDTAVITSLEGIEYCENLESLYIQADGLSDISVLSNNTKLEYLTIYETQITNIDVLENLVNLTTLTITFANITDIQAINSCTKLQKVSISSDSPIPTVNLYDLPDLKELFLNYNGIEEITLTNLPKLEELRLNGNKIESIDDWDDLPKLRTLDLWHNPVADISSLESFQTIVQLTLGINKEIDTSTFPILNSLSYLRLDDCNLTDIDFLSAYTNLLFLDVSYNELESLSGISEMTKLEDLVASYNNISDISALSNLNLKELELEVNNIDDVQVISTLDSLRFLVINQNHISDLSPLYGMPSLILTEAWAQTIELPQYTTNGRVTVANTIKDSSNEYTIPQVNGGTYQSSSKNIIWNNIRSDQTLSFTFDSRKSLETYVSYFTGTVTILVKYTGSNTDSTESSSRDRDEDDYSQTNNTTTTEWKQDLNGWQLRKANGSYAKDEWIQLNNKWYWFDSTGYAGTGWRLVNNRWYFMNPNCAMVANDWTLQKGKWYFLNADGSMRTSWVQWKNVWYYLNSSGDMAVSTTTPDGYKVDANGAWIR